MVRSEDGTTTWKPGCNFSLCIPTDEAEGWLPGSIAVKDAWDDSTRLIRASRSATAAVYSSKLSASVHAQSDTPHALQVGVREGESDEAIVKLSVERAMKVLDMAMGQAYGLQEESIDPIAPDRLAADRAVAAAARHAIALTRALKVRGHHTVLCVQCTCRGYSEEGITIAQGPAYSSSSARTLGPGDV